MELDRKTKKEIKKVVKEATEETLSGTLSKMLGNEPKKTTAVLKPGTPRSTSIITPHEANPPKIPKPPAPGTRKRRHPMAVRGPRLFWRDTVIEAIGLAIGIAAVVGLFILIVKWGQWLWRVL